ncbi:M15 family metallopeptidase [Candidatus Saccharibacteria bacterium]|nr:M15 family metallopeptidase [Candidatus Saccharibacteria bacterium]
MDFHPYARKRLLRYLLLFLVLGIAVAGIAWWRGNQQPINSQSAVSDASGRSAASPSGFNKSQYSVNDPASLWVVVNKGRILPSDYVPADPVVPNVSLNESASSDNMHLRRDAATALEKLTSAASGESIKLMLVSGYRSYATQQSVYSGYVSSQGKAYADATSAQPGHSEHQTGLAADLGAISGKCQLEPCFGDMAEGKWLAANAHDYGFIIRYQKNKTNLTGYDYEPWHLRYVGVELAAVLNKADQTLEQFFSLPAYPSYSSQIYQLKN